MLRFHRDPSPGLSLPLRASVTCIGPTRTFQNQWVKLTPISAHSHFTEGETEAVASQSTPFLHLSGNTSSLPAWPQPPPVGAGGPPCTFQGVRSTRRAWPSGSGGDAWASPAATIFLAAVTSPAASPRAGGSQRPAPAPKPSVGPGWGGPLVSHWAPCSRGGGPGSRGQLRGEDGGFHGRPQQEGRRKGKKRSF